MCVRMYVCDRGVCVCQGCMCVSGVFLLYYCSLILLCVISTLTDIATSCDVDNVLIIKQYNTVKSGRYVTC